MSIFDIFNKKKEIDEKSAIVTKAVDTSQIPAEQKKEDLEKLLQLEKKISAVQKTLPEESATPDLVGAVDIKNPFEGE